MTAVIAPPIPNVVPLPQLVHANGLAPAQAPNELRLDPDQQLRLENTLPRYFDFFVNQPFRFHGILDPKVLAWHFQNLLRIHLPEARLTALPMIGSTIPDALQNTKEASNDIDFFGAIDNVNSLPEKKWVEYCFLEALRASLEIDAFDIMEPDGSISTSFFHRPYQAFLIKLPKGQSLFKMQDFRLLKGLRCEDDGPFYARIPLFVAGQERDLDFTIGWGKDAEPNCFTSRDCFSSEFLPKLNGSKEPLRVAGLRGYDVQKAWHLLKEGYYYVNEEEAAKLRCGLRGYARTPTRGYRPVKFSSEEAFFEKWQTEYGFDGLPKFFAELHTYLPLHYPGDFSATVAYLTNLRTIFATQKLEEKFLETFDRESSKLLANLFSHESCDFAFLRTIGFWGYFKNSRLDCKDELQESRYHFPFRSGHILAHIPWEETSALLTTPPQELEAKCAAMKPLLAKLKLPGTAAGLRQTLTQSFSQFRSNPKAALLQRLFSEDLAPDEFVSSFAAALPHLDGKDLSCIEKTLELYNPHLKEIQEILCKLREAPKEIYLTLFLDAVFAAKTPMGVDTAKALLKMALASAKTLPAIRIAARMAATFSQWIEPASLTRLGRRILEDPAANGEALFSFLSIRQPFPPETLQKILDAVPLVPVRERWIPFWHEQIDNNLPTTLLVNLIESPHFELPAKIAFTHHILQLTAHRENHDAYFACWDAAFSQKCLTQEAIPTLVAVSQAVARNPASIPWVIERVGMMQAMGTSEGSVRAIFQSITPDWLDAPRNSLQCWRILQRVTGREVDPPPSLSHPIRAALLKHLFKLDEQPDFVREMVEIGRNHPQHRVAILRDYIAFGKFLDTAPIFKRMAPEPDLSTLFLPLVQELKPMKHVVETLYNPEYNSIREECLSGLLPHLLPEHFTADTLTRILTEGPFPPAAALQRLIHGALQKNLPFLKRELFGLLKRLGAQNIPAPLAADAALYFKRAPILQLPQLQELLDLEIFPPATVWEIALVGPFSQEQLLEFSKVCVKKAGAPIPVIEEHWKKIIPTSPLPVLTTLLSAGVVSPEDLWQGSIGGKKSPEEMLFFSEQCLQKAEHPIPAVETFWSKTVSQPRAFLQWPMFLRLHSLPHTSADFKQTVVQGMETFLGKDNNYSSQLDLKSGVLAPLVPTVVERAVEKRKPEKALEFLLARKDALETMPVAKLWGLIAALSRAESRKGAYLDNLDRLINIGLDRLSQNASPRENSRVLAETIAHLPEPLLQKYKLQFFELYSNELIKLNGEPIREFWNFLKPLFLSKEIPETFKDFAAKMLVIKIGHLERPKEALRYLNLVLQVFADQPATEATIDLFNRLIDRMGPEAYRDTDAVQCWTRLAKDPWFIESDEMHARICQFQKHFSLFAKEQQLIDTALFIRLAIGLDNYKLKSGTSYLTDYLGVLNNLPPSDKREEMVTRSEHWLRVCRNVAHCSADLDDMALLCDLHKHAYLSKEYKALGFLAIQSLVMHHIESAGQAGLKVKNLSERLNFNHKLGNFHAYFTWFYEWLAEQKDLTINPIAVKEVLPDEALDPLPQTNARIQYRAMNMHMHLLAAARLVNNASASQNMAMALELLAFTIKHPFTITAPEIVPFLQISADVSLDGDDLCGLLDFVQPFVINGCSGPPPQMKFLSVPTFLSWLKQNLKNAGLDASLDKITHQAKAKTEKKQAPEEPGKT